MTGRWLSRLGAIIREAAASVRSQPTTAILTCLVVTVTAASILLTTGRAAGLERNIVDSIDDVGTRTITYRADTDAGLTVAAISRIQMLDHIAWVGGFSQATDITNTVATDGNRVAHRNLFTTDLAPFHLPANAPDNQEHESVAYLDDSSLQLLGLLDGTGGVIDTNGRPYTVSGRLTVPAQLSDFHHLAITPLLPHEHRGDPILTLVIVADSPQTVALVDKAATALLGVDDPSKISRQTSEKLATLRSLVSGELAAYSRTLVLSIAGIAAALETGILYGLVMMRRKDFGRRRALGASQGLIIRLILLQAGILAATGATLGVAVSALTLALEGDPLPTNDYILAAWTLSITTGLIGSLLPAIAAARRQPLTELRVP